MAQLEQIGNIKGPKGDGITNARMVDGDLFVDEVYRTPAGTVQVPTLVGPVQGEQGLPGLPGADGVPTGEAIKSHLETPGPARTALETELLNYLQPVRRQSMAAPLLAGAGEWFVKRRNADELRLMRDLGRGYFSDHILRTPQIGTTPGPASNGGQRRAACFSDLGVGRPMVVAALDAATYGGSGWSGITGYFAGTTPDETEGLDLLTATVSTTAGSTTVNVTSAALSGGVTRYTLRRIVIPGAGAGGADYVGTVANISGGNVITVSGGTPATSVTGATAVLHPKRHSTGTAAATATYTPPTGADSIGIVYSVTANGGLWTVAVDGDLTRANCLPTAQQLVDRGLHPASILTTGGGSIAPATRVIDSFHSVEVLSIWQAVATGLDPAVSHTAVFTATGLKQTPSSGTRLTVGGWGYGTPSTTPMTSGAFVFYSERVSPPFPTHELAIDHLPAGGSSKAFAGGNNHGYEFASAPVGVVVDGAAVTVAVGACVAVPGSASIAVRSGVFHPQVLGSATFDCERVYRLDRGGLSVRQFLTAKLATVVDSGYLAMFTVGPLLDRVQVDKDGQARNLHDYTANPNESYVGAGKNTGVVWWDADGVAAAAAIMPTAKRMTNDWSDTVVMVSVRNWQSPPSSKMYARYTGSVPAGAMLAGEVTYVLGRLGDGAAMYYPA